MMKNGKECLVFATGNKINFTSTDQLVFKNGTIQTLPFSCEGVHGFGTRLLIYGSNECIIREDPCSVNDVIHIVGFEGNIKETKWIDNDLFYVFTDIGIYLYDVNTGLNAHSKSVLWGEEPNVTSVAYDIDSKTLFILNSLGEIRITSSDSEADQNYSSLRVFAKSGIYSMGYVKEKKMLIFKGGTAFWKYEHLTKSWSCLYNVSNEKYSSIYKSRGA